MYRKTTLLWFLSPSLLSSVQALPSPQGDLDAAQNFNPGNVLAIQPNNGGQAADDCGAGPVTLNADTWNANGMDDLIGSMWDQGVSDPNFDFHQAFANKYGVDLFCRDSFQNCEGDPVSCSDLTGTTQEKTQGWLGIKAMMEVQNMYTQTQVVTTLVDGVQTALATYQHKITDKPYDNQRGRKAFVNTIGAVLTTAVGFWALGPLSIPLIGSVSLGTEMAIGLGTGVGVVTSYANDAIDDNQAASSGTPDWSVTQILDRWEDVKTTMRLSIDMQHSAAFSNGQANGIAGPTMKDILKGGGFSGTSFSSAYENAENNIRDLMERVLFSKVLEGSFKEAYNAFYLYIPGVTKDCQGWHGNTGKKDEMRFCGQNGMYILMGLNPDNDLNMNSPPGAGTDDLKSYGDYNIQLQDLHQSSAATYEGHGLVHDGISYFMTDIINAWQAKPDQSIFAQPGFFYLPVCQIQGSNWKQSDSANKNQAPCDCKTATDPWGNKFYDQATQPLQNWIDTTCK